MTVDEAMRIAVEHHQAGRLQSAEGIYRQILQQNPRNAAVLQMLGVIAIQTGHHDHAVKLLKSSIAIDPSIPQAHNNLGLTYHALEQIETAIESYRRALQIKPQYPEALNNLGNTLYAQKKMDEAVNCYQSAIALLPNYPEALNNLGNAYQKLGRTEEAIVCYRRALAARPNYSEARSNLGAALQAAGDLTAAVAEFSAAVEMNPSDKNAKENLEIALKADRQKNRSLEDLQRDVNDDPTSEAALVRLGDALEKKGRLGEARSHYQRALAAVPESHAALRGMTTVLTRMGQPEEALEFNRRALQADPGDAVTLGNLIFALQDVPVASAEEIFREHRRWNELHAASFKSQIPRHDNDRSAGRRLRMGYVSPDFHNHSVPYFLLPLLEHHDHERFHITCYSANNLSDDITEKFRRCSDNWRSIAAMDDDDAAALIHRERIDILVDLTGHTAGGRLGIFARKPAPVQVGYLGYFNTTGLDTMDYWITDAHNDPPGQTEPYCTEELWRLPDTFACYRPPANAPAVEESPPMVANGYVTFASFNKLVKLNRSVLALWAKVLAANTGSKLLIQAKGLDDTATREGIMSRLREQQIAPEQVELLASQTMDEHLKTVTRRADICLDSFPFTGHTVSLHALWMGVPLVTLAGDRHVARRGVGVLENLGLADLIAPSEETYVRIASDLGRDVDRLCELRQTLRPRLSQSPLMDEVRLAKNIEGAYQQMWKRWRESQPPV